MGKILALDLGARWVGTALSDSLKIIAQPHITVERPQLEIFLERIIEQERIEAIVIGYPKTLRGTVSEQTQHVLNEYEALKQRFSHVTFLLWDERLSSKRTETLRRIRTPEEKRKSHSIAAAFILDSYLTFLSHQQSQENDHS